MERQQADPQFIYPVPFDQFVNGRKRQEENIKASYDITEYSKLRKMKKLLETTQAKISNRIKLFKKISMDIQKKKEKENTLHQRHESLRKSKLIEDQKPKIQPSNYLRPTKSSACGIRIRKTIEMDRSESSLKKIEALVVQKHDQAKQIKMWKQRNRVILEQRRQKQQRKKLQSANLIRNNRERVKEIKMLCEHERIEEARKFKQQKFKEEIEKYDQLQENLTRLQREEREALIMWKRTMEAS